MRKIAFTLFCLLSINLLFGQSPLWLDSEWRSLSYSSNKYFSDFVSTSVSTNEKQENKLNELRKEVQNHISENISVQIKGEQSSFGQSIQQTKEQEQIFSKYQSQISSKTDVKLVELQIDHYYDEAKKRMYVFGYVSKAKLSDYYRALVEKNLTKIEQFITLATQLESQKAKLKAKQQIGKAVEILPEMDYAMELLLVVNKNSFEDIQNKHNELYSKLLQITQRLEQSIVIYLKSVEDNFGTSSKSLSSKLKSLLSKDCSFTDKLEEADYLILIVATTRKGSSNEYLTYAFADINIEIRNTYTNLVIFNELLQTNDGGTNLQNAGDAVLRTGGEKSYNQIIKFLK